MKNIILTFRFLSYIPALYLIVFYIGVVWACIYLGKIPIYDNPDPKTIPLFGFILLLERVLSMYTLLSIVFYPIFLIVLLFKKTYKLNKSEIFLFVITSILSIISFTSKLGEWYAD